ncbi:Actin family protein [Cryptosporidium felis]|nr:Actin family protein [Cryptosporidium felis]
MEESGLNRSYILISVGRRHVKAGFSKKVEPFVILQTSELFRECVDTLEIASTDESAEGDFDYVTIFRDPKSWRRSWSLLIRKLYTDYLVSNPRDYPVILLERPFFPSDLSNFITQILLKDYQVPGVKRISEPLVSLYTTGLRTGIVVDVGAEDTIVCPVYEGFPVEYNTKILRCGYNDLMKKFKRELLLQYKNKPDEELVENIEDGIIDDIIFQSGAVKREFGEDLNTSKISDFTYENLFLKGKYLNLKVSKETRTEPFELFFGGSSGEGSKFICDIVLDGVVEVLKNSNCEIRKELSQNILLCGGLASVPGFEQRVMHDLQEILPNDKKLQTLDQVFVSAPPISPFLRSYYGAVLMLQTEKVNLNRELSEIYESQKTHESLESQ